MRKLSVGVSKDGHGPIWEDGSMPLAERVYSFPELPRRTFRGLPGLLADSLPDRFGNNLINAWLARQGRTPG